jgi:vitamin B12 transporter
VRYFLIIGILIFVTQFCFCQKQVADSLKVYPIAEVVVTATRSAISIHDSPVNVDILDINDVKSVNGSTVADLLKNSAGMFINDLGGGASLKTALVRGSSSQNLLILVDGIRQNSMQNGIGVLNPEFLTNIDIIEIVHGGNSALYGSDAVGGVVNIITRKQKPHPGIEFETSVGSYDFSSYLFNANGNLGPIGLYIGYVMERSRDNYLFRENSLQETARANADYTKSKWIFSLMMTPHPNSYLQMRGQFYKTEFGVPGSMTYPTPNARQSDNDAGIFVNYESNAFKNMILTVRSGFRYTLENYRDPQEYFPIDAYYKNFQLNLNPQIEVRMTDNIRTIIGGEFSEGALWSNDFDTRIIRAQKALYISGETNFTYDRFYLDRFFLFQAVRFDNTSDLDHAITPKIGINVRLLKKGEVRVRMSAGQNFRVPTFNDLYFRNISNPDLKSERSSCFDAGLSAEGKLLGDHRGSLTYFYQDITDRITFDLTTFTPKNLGKAISEGVEIRYGCILFNHLLDIDLNYSFTDTRKMDRYGPTDSTYGRQLAYVPNDLFNMRVSLKINPITVTLFQNFVGKRYTTADNLMSIPSFMISGVNARTEVTLLGLQMMLKAEINNIFNKSYETFEGYPMPGRIFRGTVGLSY